MLVPPISRNVAELRREPVVLREDRGADNLAPAKGIIFAVLVSAVAWTAAAALVGAFLW